MLHRGMWWLHGREPQSKTNLSEGDYTAWFTMTENNIFSSSLVVSVQMMLNYY